MPLYRRIFFLVALLGLLISLSACVRPPAMVKTATPSLTHTPTITATPSRTATASPSATFTPSITWTLVPTITPRPTRTPSITFTPLPSATPTMTETPAPLQPATLFTLRDTSGVLIDWEYAHVTQLRKDKNEVVNDLWVMMAFRLMDRAIHRRTMVMNGEPVTVYYLYVMHTFDGVEMPFQLILGGTPGDDVPLSALPADGSAYIRYKLLSSKEPVDPYIIHRDALRDYDLREESYPTQRITDLEALLADLPDEVILLADHFVLVPRDDWHQHRLDMERVSYLAARFAPFFTLNAYDRIEGQSPWALSLADYLVHGYPPAVDFFGLFSAQTLIIVTGK